MQDCLTYSGICLVYVVDPSREEGVKGVDIGNYYTTLSGQRVLVLSQDNAVKYGHLVPEQIYVKRLDK